MATFSENSLLLAEFGGNNNNSKIYEELNRATCLLIQQFKIMILDLYGNFAKVGNGKINNLAAENLFIFDKNHDLERK